MRLISQIPKLMAFLIAAGFSLLVAYYSVEVIEDRSEIGVRSALDTRGFTWAEVSADGLQVTLDGVAPTEALRFSALTAAGSIVDAARVIDRMEVTALANLAPPRFSAEILRNDAGLSVIGLIPLSQDRAALEARFADLVGDEGFADFLETADHPAPEGWSDAMSFALAALGELPRAKVSVEAGRVRINAMAGSSEEEIELERALSRAAPPGLIVSLDIIAPRPVLTPFTLRFVSDNDGIRFDACSADTVQARARILQAAFAAGLTGSNACEVGMGVPTPRWSEAVELAIAAVSDLGGGTVTFSDADVALFALEGTGEDLFDRVVGELENALPEVFALKALLPKPEDPTIGPPEFTATLSPEGQVQLRGRVADLPSRELITSFAQSLFGTSAVYSAARIADNLPTNWSTRVLTGLEAMGYLSNGALLVTPDAVRVSGTTGDPQAKPKITQLLG